MDPEDFFCKIHPEVPRDVNMRKGYYKQLMDYGSGSVVNPLHCAIAKQSKMIKIALAISSPQSQAIAAMERVPMDKHTPVDSRVVVYGGDGPPLTGERQKQWRSDMTKANHKLVVGTYQTVGYRNDGRGLAQTNHVAKSEQKICCKSWPW